MKIDQERAQRSTEWLLENYRHIVEAPEFSLEEKAGFLAASCHPTRCYLMTLSLRQRLDLIAEALMHRDAEEYLHG